jgi:hypothetical protein
MTWVTESPSYAGVAVSRFIQNQNQNGSIVSSFAFPYLVKGDRDQNATNFNGS